MAAEVPILEALGYEVFIPRLTPDVDPELHRAIAEHQQGASFGLHAAELAELIAHDFYVSPWSPSLIDMLNERFDVLVAACTGYPASLFEAVRHFEGKIVARAFGREHPRTFGEFFAGPDGAPVLARIGALGDRFIFGQAYRNIAEEEGPELASRARDIVTPLGGWVYERAGDWNGRSGRVLLLCPRILETGYYRDIYNGHKRDFGHLPHEIFGRQVGPVGDPAILPYLSDKALLDRYAAAAVFVYPSTEPRHVHYSPIEAMVVGTPVLYRQDALIGRVLDGANLPGACRNTAEMRTKAGALVAGDRDLADAIRAGQGVIVEHLSGDLARRQWSAVLSG